jgi:hypothetical protein
VDLREIIATIRISGDLFLLRHLKRVAASKFVWNSAAKDALLCASAG